MDKSNSKTKQKQNGGIKFFLVVLFIYFIIALFNTHLIVKAVIDFLNMFIKIIPIICIVFIVMIGIDLYFNNERTKKYFGEKSGVKGWIYAIVSGSLISAPPLCSLSAFRATQETGNEEFFTGSFFIQQECKNSLCTSNDILFWFKIYSNNIIIYSYIFYC